MPRKYTKSSPYWEQRKARATILSAPDASREAPILQRTLEAEASFDEAAHYTAVAACGGGDIGTTTYRNQFAPTYIDSARYKNIRGGIVPFYGDRNGYYSVGDAISLVYSAFFNVAVIRNSVTLLQDFSVSPLKVATTNLTVKRFFENWFDAINLQDFMSQFFLEYYRSGNVFIYKFNGKIENDKFNMLKTALGAKSDELPVRYSLLNPMQVYLQMGPTYNYNFVRMLSTYELARLRDPKTQEDKAVLKSFPSAIQQQIKQYSSLQYIYAPLDTERLYYVFNNKQDYEPLAVPPIWPVLNDVELKLEMKKIDLSLVRMLEQVLLLVTTGEKADQWNAGTNPKNLVTLQALFKSQTIGRVLVADYTTKAEWKIPDLKELLGPAKYERVDQDIKEGLQYMFFGDEKFANAAVKAKIFIQGLKEGRRAFLDRFLRPEIKKICQKMNFKVLPEVEFEDIDIEDPAAINRIYYQMAQLGLLTADELNQAIETGILPTREESVVEQIRYKTLRDKGLYQPLLGKPQDGGEGRPNGTGSPKSSNTISPIGTTKASISMARLLDTIPAINALEEAVIEGYKKRYKLKKLDAKSPAGTTPQADVARLTTQAIVLNEPQERWQESIASYLEAPKEISADTLNALARLGADHPELTPWQIAILHKSRIES